MAAAVTSGVVALMIDANRETHDAPLTPNTVKAILEYTALPMRVRRSAVAGNRQPERRRGGACSRQASTPAFPWIHGGSTVRFAPLTSHRR